MIVPFLLQLLEHSNEYVRYEAIQSLGQLGASETALAIVQSRRSEQWRPGMGITEALMAFGAQIEVEPILALVNDPSTPDQILSDAIIALGVSRDRRVIEPLSAFITQHRFLFAVIQALGNTQLPEAIPLLVQVLEDNTNDFPDQGSLSRENLDHMVITSLGKLQHPGAFNTIEYYARKNLPTVWHVTINALAASGGERAIPILDELWRIDPEKRKTILTTLLWIGTPATTEKILELLSPLNKEKGRLLAMALSHGSRLDAINSYTFSVGVMASTDDQLVAIVDTYFDEMDLEGMQHALIAMKYIATARAQQLLERIASIPKYEISPSNITPSPVQTIRDMAIHKLWELGSGVVIDAVLDTLSDYPANVVEFRLTRMKPELVRKA